MNLFFVLPKLLHTNEDCYLSFICSLLSFLVALLSILSASSKKNHMLFIFANYFSLKCIPRVRKGSTKVLHHDYDFEIHQFLCLTSKILSTQLSQIHDFNITFEIDHSRLYRDMILFRSDMSPSRLCFCSTQWIIFCGVTWQ